MQAITTDGRTVNIVGVSSGQIDYYYDDDPDIITALCAAWLSDDGKKYMIAISDKNVIASDFSEYAGYDYSNNEDYNVVSTDFDGVISLISRNTSSTSPAAIASIPLLQLLVSLVPITDDNYIFLRPLNVYVFNNGSFSEIYMMKPEEDGDIGLLECNGGFLSFTASSPKSGWPVSQPEGFLIDCDYNISQQHVDNVTQQLQIPVGYGTSIPDQPPFVYNAFVLNLFYGFPQSKFPWMDNA